MYSSIRTFYQLLDSRLTLFEYQQMNRPLRVQRSPHCLQQRKFHKMLKKTSLLRMRYMYNNMLCRHTLACNYSLGVTVYMWHMHLTLTQAVQVVFDGSSKRIKSITNKLSKISVNVDQGFYWYNSSDGHNKNSTQRSGAYIFRYMQFFMFTH